MTRRSSMPSGRSHPSSSRRSCAVRCLAWSATTTRTPTPTKSTPPRVRTRNVCYDHPFHSALDHVLGIDFINEAQGGRERVAVELSADSARALVEKILAALASGEAEHGKDAHSHAFVPRAPIAAE